MTIIIKNSLKKLKCSSALSLCKLRELSTLSVLVLGVLGFANSANAAGTLAGTTINNTANLNFTIGNVAQNPVASNQVSFVVDNKINLMLVEDQGGVPTNTTPGATTQVLKFKLTNLGNSAQDYTFSANSMASGATVFGRTDSFDASSCQVFVDSVANSGLYEAAIDTQPYVDELAPDTSKEVFVVCSIPTTRVNNDFAITSLVASTATGGSPGVQGAPLSQSTGVNTAGVDVVFSDAGGVDDSARDGKYSARSGYLVQAATLAVVKTATPICDPINFLANPKAIPGSFVRYAIAITNASTAGSSANLANMTDVIDSTNLNFDQNLIAPTASSCDMASPPESAMGRAFKLSCTGGTRACVATPAYKTAASDADGFDFTTGTITAGFASGLAVEPGYAAGELKPGESVKFEFNVQVK